ncbi:MAG: hypothetical protein D6773_04425 [Alphaproteobacteria bacterium]|nr:MAG: hypothetical protein D6773_04425 [Alphaproteobacteria bacterium]
MTKFETADRHWSLVTAASQKTKLVTDINLVLGQSNAGGSQPSPIEVPATITGPGVAWGVRRSASPELNGTLLSPFQNGANHTTHFGASSWSPPFAQRWYDLTGRSSLWANLAFAGTPLVGAAIPGADHWAVSPWESSLIGASTLGVELPRNIILGDVFEAHRINPLFGDGLRLVHWIQGEADANSVALDRLGQDDYAEELDFLFSYLKRTYAIDHFLIYELGRKGTTLAEVQANEAQWQGYMEIRAAQNSVAALRADTFMIFTGAKETGTPFNTLTVDASGYHVSGFSYMADGVHFDSASHTAMGLTAARNLSQLLGL